MCCCIRKLKGRKKKISANCKLEVAVRKPLGNGKYTEEEEKGKVGGRNRCNVDIFKDWGRSLNFGNWSLGK